MPLLYLHTGLAYMLMHGVYSDALCIHAPSKLDPVYPDPSDEESIGNASFLSSLSDVKEDDPRKNLNDTWLKWKKFQPLWKIRNYFGEQIALYFAWLGKHPYIIEKQRLCIIVYTLYFKPERNPIISSFRYISVLEVK